MKNTLWLALLFSLPLAAGTDDSFLLRGGTVHPVSGPDIPNASVLVRDGKITAVGAGLSAPKGVRVIDIKGRHVYPGMIDSATAIGLSEIASVAETDDTSEIGSYHPQLRAIVGVNPASEHIPVTRANGITSVITLPWGGVLCGQAALIHLDGWTWQEMAVAPSAAMVLRFPVVEPLPEGPQRGRREKPSFAARKRDYDRRLRELGEFFEQARRYRQAKAAGAPGFQADLKLEAMLPVLDGKLPLVVHAVRERAIRDAIKFSTEQKIPIVIAEATEAWKLAPELKAKNIPLILGPTLALPLDDDDPYDKPYSAPGELYKAGVKFAFGSFDTQFVRDLPYQASMAVAFGLPYNEALKAVTLNAAEIFRVADEIGSIDKGKWADLIVTDGDPLETRTQILQEYIKGKPVDLESKHRRLYERYLKR
jgi:imidazolonepropionase-like amidohydrolase